MLCADNSSKSFVDKRPIEFKDLPCKVDFCVFTFASRIADLYVLF